jgi:hypothetical protein
MQKTMMLSVYVGEDDLGIHLSVDGLIDGKSYSLGSIDIETYPKTLHEALILPELIDLSFMRQLTELNDLPFNL